MLSSSSLNLNILNQQSKKEGKCAVCGKDAFFYHYNVFSCNGCKQFFRRSIIENRKYICPRKSICEIKNGIKCRACRLSKCLNAGMNKLLVQQLALKNKLKNQNGACLYSQNNKQDNLKNNKKKLSPSITPTTNKNCEITKILSELINVENKKFILEIPVMEYLLNLCLKENWMIFWINLIIIY
uniref:Nuclear receptor domain-containing protein n=1 Tax=Meloidogyne enterolobii TaxID=390850 RepID=A0A6V7W5I2_MELEN|nr:unnamed protein product [Meloidogyne enterolobii]